MQRKSCLRLLNAKTVESHGGLSGLIRHDRRENIWSDQEINEALIGSNAYHILRSFDDVRKENAKTVKDKTGRRMQDNTLDIREAVVELPDGISIEKLEELGHTICRTPILRSKNKKVYKGKKSILVSEPILDKNGKQVISPLGVKLIAAFLHKDEGHWINRDGDSAHLQKDENGNWRDVDGTVHDPKKEGLLWKVHTHGHLWFSMIDLETGKTIRISSDELSQLQTLVAETLGMERGEYNSKRTHLDQKAYNKKQIRDGLANEVKQKQAERDTITAEVNNLIHEKDELISDYAEKKEEVQADIQQLEISRNTLSAEVDEEKKKRQEAEARAKEAEVKAKELETKAQEAERKTMEAEEKSKKAEEILSVQKKDITHNKGVIANQVADFNARKEELAQIKTDIETNKQTITQQKQTISDNEATIQKQEKQKAATVINDDAAERAILEKYGKVLALAGEEVRLQRSIKDKRTELATVDANVTMRKRQLAAKIDLDTIPKKGLMGYRPDDVERFLESVNTAKLLQAINKDPYDIMVDEELQKEVTQLRAVEDDYKDFRNSPQRMQQRIEYLETEAKRRSITEILKYALQKTVEVIHFTVDKTPKGEDIFAKFTIKGDNTRYAGHISPEERISYTNKDLNSLQECKDNSNERIWWVIGSLSEIQAKREKEDTLSRYSTKLSTLLSKKIQVKDYVTEGGDYLLNATDGRKYLVQKSGKTYSTTDERVKKIKDAYSVKIVWTSHGDINNPKIRQGLHL